MRRNPLADPARAHARGDPVALPRWRVFPPLALGTIMATLDISVVNIALPTLSRAFGVPLTTIEWVVLAYVLTITGLLLTLGRLADRIGRRRVYGAGLGLFTIASALCAGSPGAHALIAARALQGLGAAMMTANSAAILIANFPESERGRAIGAFGAMVGVGLALGPPLGGFLVHLSWRWIFILNLPLGVLALLQLRTRVPPDPPAAPAGEPRLWMHLSLPSATWWCAALVLLMLGLSRGPEARWQAPGVWLLFLAGALALGCFLVVDRRAVEPLLPLDVLRGPLGVPVLLTLVSQALAIAVGFHMPLYFEDVLGFDAARSGRWMAVLPLAALLVAPLAGRWSDRWGSRRLASAGLAITVAGFLALSRLSAAPPAALILAGMSLVGVGLGLFNIPNASEVMSAVSRERLGLASGLQGTMRNLGISGGAAAVAAITASRYAAHGGGVLQSSGPQGFSPVAFARASQELYLGMAALGALAFLVSRRPGSRLPRRAGKP